MSSKLDSQDPSVKTEWVHCNSCLNSTKHFILAEHEKRVVAAPCDEYGQPWWHSRYTLLVCCGCDSATLRRRLDFSEWDDYEVDFYPPQVSRHLPSWRYELPGEMIGLLTEIYSALHADNRRLALMGARTIIDIFVVDKIGDIGTFKQKLQALVDKGYLASQQQSVLDVALEAGHAAAHRGYQPTSEVLDHVIDVVESLLQTYALETASNLVKKKIPPRPR